MNNFDLGGLALRVGRAITPPDLKNTVSMDAKASIIPTASAGKSFSFYYFWLLWPLTNFKEIINPNLILFNYLTHSKVQFRIACLKIYAEVFIFKAFRLFICE